MSPKATVNPDLARERKACEVYVDTAALTILLDGSAEKTQRRRELQCLVEDDPVFTKEGNIFMTRPERYRHSMRKARRFSHISRSLALSPEDEGLLLTAVSDTLPTLLHNLMFVPNLRALCSDEQLQLWLPLCETMQVIGCYAQTELGHGSNIRALETTATYIPETEEFEIHSPTLTSTKFWPGSIGITANTAMVIAQLIVDGKRLGLHNFIVGIRDRETHQLLKGVTAGDIGPKLGFTPMDNGFCRFDKVRIPRANMAARYSWIDEAGKYAKLEGGETQPVAYLTMMQVRTFIVGKAGFNLAKAVTIATRYSVVRRQGFGPAKEELQVIDYTMQLHRLLPLLATAFAFHFTGVTMLSSLRTLEAGLEEGAPGTGTLMADLHSSSAGLKSLCSSIAAEGIEDCRKCCGGHGYLLSSGLPELLGDYMQNCTVEGENHMLTQQTVKHLLKVRAKAAAAGDSQKSKKASKCQARSRSEIGTFPVLRDAFTHRANRLLDVVASTMATARNEGKSSDQAWNRSLVEVWRASRAHCLLLVFEAFAAETFAAEERGPALPKATARCLKQLLSLFGLYWIERDMGDFTEDNYLNSEQAGWVRKEVVELLHNLRPKVVGLVDAWDFSDHQLGSVLGRYDGDVYTALMQSAAANPMNQLKPADHEHLLPLIQGIPFAPPKL